MRRMAFSVRTMKEILRDPLNILFGLGFPVILILLLSAIQANIPVSLFKIESLTPGISVFGLSFLSYADCEGQRERSAAKVIYYTDDRDGFYSWLCAAGLTYCCFAKRSLLYGGDSSRTASYCNYHICCNFYDTGGVVFHRVRTCLWEYV